MAVLEAKNVAKSYRLPGQRRIPVLQDVSLAVEAGEHVAVVGRSGAGKTTFLNILGGLDKPTSGDVLLDGESFFCGFGASRRRNRLRAAKIGFVFQRFNLIDELNVEENVELPLTYLGVPKKERKVRAEEVLRRIQPNFQAASSSAWPLPVRSCAHQRSSLQTNRLATSTN